MTKGRGGWCYEDKVRHDHTVELVEQILSRQATLMPICNEQHRPVPDGTGHRGVKYSVTRGGVNISGS